MRFMLMRMADPETESSVMPTEELVEAMGAYMDDLNAAGVLLGGDGLQPSSKGARVEFKAGKPTVVDGPFAESKELIAGYTIIQAGSLQEALEWARKWPPLDGDGSVRLEVRPIYELEDLGEGFTPELREAVGRTRADVAAKHGSYS